MKRLFKLLFSVTFLALYVSCGSEENVEYVPTEEFVPAYNALLSAQQDSSYEYREIQDGKIVKVAVEASSDDDCYYDLEETVRILNGLEMAQTQSPDFFSFLEYMAKQDYSMVPKEIVSAKMELLPILQEMFILERDNGELQGLTAVTSSLGTGFYALAKESNLADVAAGAISIAGVSQVPLLMALSDVSVTDAISKAIGSESLSKAQTAAFDHYEQQKELKREYAKRIAKLKAQYLTYIEKFTPIYMKYMNEWEKLCLEKDKAYLAVYSGRNVDAYQTIQQILNEYPANREMMLLKALACVNLAKELSGDQKYAYSVEAQNTLENYIDLYPGKAAPALVLLGEVELMNGKPQRAMSYFDQASIEYPKQAEELKDMLNSYKLRNYLDATAEGKYLMRLYCSTMEGYGWFSPNFHKAMYLESVGQNEQASLEIYNHFFRRGNQGLYDCLLTDMEFCENNLFKSYKSQFMESSALNVSVAEETNLFSKNGVKFTLTNNTDLKVENVRLYMCLHLKDMYINEYDVFACSSINALPASTEQTWETTDYSIDDIVRVRAILMTDDRVCWVDDVSFKNSNAMKNYYQLNGKLTKSLDMFGDYGLSNAEIDNSLTKGFSGQLVTPSNSAVSGFFKGMVGAEDNNILTIRLPRVLCMLDPVFSLGELGTDNSPERQTLKGSSMKLEFERKPGAAYEPLYMYSDFVNVKIDYTVSNAGDVKISKVTRI